MIPKDGPSLAHRQPESAAVESNRPAPAFFFPSWNAVIIDCTDLGTGRYRKGRCRYVESRQ